MIEEEDEEDEEDLLSFLEKLLEIEDEEEEEEEEEGTEHLVEELLMNTGDLVEEALVEKLLENFDLEEEEEAVVSFFDSFHFSSMNNLCFCRDILIEIQMNGPNVFDCEFCDDLTRIIDWDSETEIKRGEK